MNNLKTTILIAFSFLAIFNVNAQGVNKALKEFQQTEFMVQFTKMQYEAKQSVRKFKTNRDLYDAADVAAVKEAYNKTAMQYNKLLAGIKVDFLNKKKMKYIANMPHEYSKSLELDLRRLEDFYNINYQQALMDVTGEADGNGLIILLTQVFQFAEKMVAKIIEIRQAAKHFTAEMLETRLVEPARFLYWDEIQVPTVQVVDYTANH